MKAWPPTVPEFVLLAGYSETPVSNWAEFQPEVGPPKRRRRSSISMSILACGIHATDVQLETFLTWYAGDLADGSLEFQREHPRTLETNVFLFQTQPVVTPITPELFEVRFELMKLY